jgi:MiaB/RimO family radical SAM methylthiotransferase
MTKVFIYVIACEKRSLDANKIRKYLTENSYEIVTKPDNANIIIFVTCGFNNEVSEIALKQIKEFQKYDAELIVAGCVPAIDKEELSKIFNGKTITTKELDQIDRLFPENKIKFNNIDDVHSLLQNFDERSSPKIFRKIKGYILKILLGKHSPFYISFLQKSYYHITISGGCLGNCSYCAIKKGIGPLKSKPLDQIIKEFKKGLDEGHKKFVTVADDTGAYGLDIGYNFSELFDELTKIQGDYEIFCGGPSPHWLVRYIDELEKILKRKKIIALQIAIQSGSSRILKLMHRYSNVKKIKAALTKIRKTYPDIPIIYTHVIIGFPTETEEDLQQTLQFIKEVKFHGGFIFRFSCKAGTLAEKLEQKIPEKEISRRMKYAKKLLKKEGYRVIRLPTSSVVSFSKRN